MFQTIRGKRINYEFKQSPNQATVLFVHGWGGLIRSLQPLANLLALKFSVLTLDLPGFGQSDDPDPNWGVEEYSEILIQFLGKLNLNKVIYFGHSFGGNLGIFISAKYPEFIEKLILANSSYKRQNKPSKLSKFFSKTPTIVKQIVYRVVFPNSDLYKFPQLEKNFRQIIIHDLSPLLPEIKQPTLILWGENDSETPVELAYELKNKIKNSSLKIFPEVGHSLPLKYPELVSKEILKFLC